MTKTMTAVRACLLTACALLAVGPVPAAQAAAPQKPVRDGWLYVTVTQGETRAGETRGTLLLCDPPKGRTQTARAHAVRACQELRAVNGDISRIQPRSVHCPMVYAPVTASARGTWHGRRIGYTKTFSNACAMKAETGSVFALAD
ncbi:SSI family serine proteinase inhibitor [Streptomyces sporangiiformans]|uniref:Serine protease n=1 Tax=Streptomyces sporangiiformans TaxID=2315329 RepID=A0A505DFM6_9ACTN|nr:SSI family serine proteinase inhibitor [Streptomyces sporangiiformans]TPQ16689.1 serine protease [Streptomyces sporangiiformans]